MTEQNFNFDPFQRLRELLERSEARIGILGMGYVGQPLALAFCEKAFAVFVFDLDSAKVDALNRGISTIGTVSSTEIQRVISAGKFAATSDMTMLSDMDVVIICVPTPLTVNREPDLTYVTRAAHFISGRLKSSQLVVLESTTYPGTTRDVLRPILERSGLAVSKDFFLAYSPEREDPGNGKFNATNTPKIIGADDACSRDLAELLYSKICNETVPVLNSATAESVKLLENIFRSVNIAMVNELRLIMSEMGVNIWEVIRAASTKPFGFMPFYSGPGLGGHCIPVDPFYLSWKAKQYGLSARFIELAGEVNREMPHHVFETVSDSLSQDKRKSVRGSRILLIGVAYKKNVDDVRESPALFLFDLLQRKGASIDYYDPYVPELLPSPDHPNLQACKSLDWSLINGDLNRPGFRGGWLVLIMRLLSFPADCVCIVPQTLPVEYDRWVQTGVFG